jgi:hypothetical protein
MPTRPLTEALVIMKTVGTSRFSRSVTIALQPLVAVLAIVRDTGRAGVNGGQTAEYP